MKPRLLLTLALAGLAGGASGAPAPPQADPAGAVQRQLDVALAAGTSAALVLFIARYPDETADPARAALAVRRVPDPRPDSGPDGDIAAAFDQARLAGPGALEAFAIRNGNHPLGVEALRWSHLLREDRDTRGNP